MIYIYEHGHPGNPWGPFRTKELARIFLRELSDDFPFARYTVRDQAGRFA